MKTQSWAAKRRAAAEDEESWAGAAMAAAEVFCLSATAEVVTAAHQEAKAEAATSKRWWIMPRPWCRYKLWSP